MTCKHRGQAPPKLQEMHDRFWGDREDDWCRLIDRFVTKETCQSCEAKHPERAKE